MKKNIISGSVVIVLGLLIALGPQSIFKICAHGEGGFPLCHWTGRAEIGIGILIASLGICLIVFPYSKTHLGLFTAIFLTGIIALFIPHTLIGGCAGASMSCRKIAFPALTVESILLVAFSMLMVILIEIKLNKDSAGMQR